MEPRRPRPRVDANHLVAMFVRERVLEICVSVARRKSTAASAIANLSAQRAQIDQFCAIISRRDAEGYLA